MTTEKPELQVRIDRLSVDVESAVSLNGGPGTAGVERARDAVMAVVTPIVDELQTRIQVRHNTLIAAEQQIESLRADIRRALGDDLVAPL